MSATAWPVVLLVLSAVAVIGWPTGGVRARYRNLFRSGRPTSPDTTGRHRHIRHVPRFRQPGPLRATGRRPPVGPPTRRDWSRPSEVPEEPDLLVADGPDGGLRAAALPSNGRPAGLPPGAASAVGQVADVDRGVIRRWAVSPGRGVPLGAVVGAAVGGLVAGPVAAVVAAAYAAIGIRALLRSRATRSVARLWRQRLDQLGALAADLRAGLPVPLALADAADDPVGRDRIDRLTRSAIRLADRTGAPLAELVERIEADLRAMDRGVAAAAAQAAGARATAWLLAALPLGGIALGYAIGADPLRVLLYTPLGAGCVVAATVLQVVGLLWTERLGATPGRAA